MKSNVKRGTKQNQNFIKKKKSIIRNVKKRKKSCDKVENFLQQVKQGHYYICTIYHGGLYQRSVRFFKHEKYQILTSELYHLVKSFDEKRYICETCQKHLYENKIPCQTVYNKMALDPLPEELKDFKKFKKVLISKRILFKKIAIMHGKGEFCERKGRNCKYMQYFTKASNFQWINCG